jgi:uncharacterized protein DUF3995
LNISGASAAGKRTRWARRIGYAACAWSLIFSLVHLYWGIEVSAGRLTVPGGAIAVGGRVDGGAWALYAGILCVMGVLVGLFRFRGERIARWMQRGVVGTACAVMTAYVVYAFAVDGFQWLIAPGLLFAAGSVIALALIQPWGRVIPRPLLLLLAWVGGSILILKTLYGASIQVLAVTGVITWQQAQTLIGAPVSQAPTAHEGTHMTLWNFLVWNPWFLLGGILFCALAWLARRDIWERADDGTTAPIKGRF